MRIWRPGPRPRVADPPAAAGTQTGSDRSRGSPRGGRTRRARPSRSTTAPGGTSSLLGQPERVADPAHRVDKVRFGPIHLLAQIADVRLDDRRVAAEIVMPDVVEDLFLGQHASRVDQHEPKQVELGGRELDRTSRAPDLVRVLVHLEVFESKPTGRLLAVTRTS